MSVYTKKMFLTGTVLFVLVSYFFVGSVVASSEMWCLTYGGAGDDVAQAIVQTSDGGYALAGFTWSSGAGKCDFWLVKTDSTGNLKWNKTYGGNKEEKAFSLVETSDGGYALAGFTQSFGTEGTSDYWLVKTDAYGNMEWNLTYGGTSDEQCNSLIQTSDGGYALVGSSLDFIFQSSWFLKTDSYGNVEWSRSIEIGDLYSVVETSDGGFALAGGWSSLLLVKTDKYGNTTWKRTYGETVARALVDTSDGGFALAGGSFYGAGSKDFWLVKTDQYGNAEWNYTYGGQGGEQVYALVDTSDGGFALAGGTYSGQSHFFLVKTDEFGNMEWNQTYGGGEWEQAFSLVEIADGGFALAGWTNSSGAGRQDFCFVKTNEYGVIPEFPSWAILPFVLTITLFSVIIKRSISKRNAVDQKNSHTNVID